MTCSSLPRAFQSTLKFHDFRHEAGRNRRNGPYHWLPFTPTRCIADRATRGTRNEARDHCPLLSMLWHGLRVSAALSDSRKSRRLGCHGLAAVSELLRPHLFFFTCATILPRSEAWMRQMRTSYASCSARLRALSRSALNCFDTLADGAKRSNP
jgi:hypothetical protein